MKTRLIRASGRQPLENIKSLVPLLLFLPFISNTRVRSNTKKKRQEEEGREDSGVYSKLVNGLEYFACSWSKARLK